MQHLMPAPVAKGHLWQQQ